MTEGPADPGRIRGAAMRGFVLRYGTENGRDGLARAVSVLPTAHQSLFDLKKRDLGLRPSAWYPVGAVHRLLDGLTAGLDAPAREDLARRAAENIMEDNLRGFLSALFRLFVSPGVCAALSQTLWNTQYDSGRVKIDRAGEKGHRMRVSGWNGHHPFLCQLNAAAGVPIYRSTGCASVTTHREACVDQGSRFCQYLIRWHG